MEITAHWVYRIYKDENGIYQGRPGWRCSHCETASLEKGFPALEQFCHSCGAHMIEKPELVEDPPLKKYSWE